MTQKHRFEVILVKKYVLPAERTRTCHSTGLLVTSLSGRFIDRLTFALKT